MVEKIIKPEYGPFLFWYIHSHHEILKSQLLLREVYHRERELKLARWLLRRKEGRLKSDDAIFSSYVVLGTKNYGSKTSLALYYGTR